MLRKSHSNTLRIINISLLIALTIILTRFLAVTFPMVRIGFGFLPIAIAAILYGPIWAGVTYAIADVIGMMVFPTGGAYFPGFTLSVFLVGIIYGFVLYGHTVTFKRAVLASTLAAVLVHLLLTTYWLSLLLGDSYIALLPIRIIKCAVMIPIEGFLIPLVYNSVLTKLPVFNKIAS
ncbi:MAG: folate family ECF transporter S component [Peptostreptococcaceae bacterium]|nr:folate family ECF transporter S component [Peptostreptococcaceae bacterium]